MRPNAHLIFGCPRAGALALPGGHHVWAPLGDEKKGNVHSARRDSQDRPKLSGIT